MKDALKGIKDDLFCANWGWILFWGCGIGWGISTIYISYVGYTDSKVYGLHMVSLLLIVASLFFDLTSVGQKLPITSIGPMSVALPIVFSLVATFHIGPHAAGLFLLHPLLYAFLSFIILIARHNK